jgi:hypothetical protein
MSSRYSMAKSMQRVLLLALVLVAQVMPSAPNEPFVKLSLMRLCYVEPVRLHAACASLRMLH